MDKILLERCENDFFRPWIIKEGKTHNEVDPIYQLKPISEEDLRFEANEEYFKILLEDKMIGFLGIKNYPKEIYLFRFYIDEEYRNHGYGTDALKQLIEMATLQGKDLSLDVYGKNKAFDLYQKLGFLIHYRRMVLKLNENQEMEW